MFLSCRDNPYMPYMLITKFLYFDLQSKLFFSIFLLSSFLKINNEALGVNVNDKNRTFASVIYDYCCVNSENSIHLLNFHYSPFTIHLQQSSNFFREIWQEE